MSNSELEDRILIYIGDHKNAALNTAEIRAVHMALKYLITNNLLKNDNSNR